MGVTGTHGIPRLPASSHGKVLFAGAKKLGYTQYMTTNMAINPVPRDGRAGCQQTGFCVQGCTFGAKWSTLYVDIPAGGGHRKGRSPRRIAGFAHRARRLRQSHRRGVRRSRGQHCSGRKRASSPSPGIRLKARACCSILHRANFRRASRIPPGKSAAITCATSPPPCSPSSTSPCTCIAARRNPES